MKVINMNLQTCYQCNESLDVSGCLVCQQCNQTCNTILQCPMKYQFSNHFDFIKGSVLE
jgi:hypothetical protein